MKGRARERREELRRRVRAGKLAGALLFVLFVVFVLSLVAPPQTSRLQVAPSKAAIVDQLSGRIPNPQFIESASGIIRRAGLEVDIFGPESVTVDLYGKLSTHGYGLMLFRVHSGPNRGEQGQPVGLFTSERYDTSSYVLEQLTDLVSRGWIFNPSEPGLFVVTPNYIRERSVTDYGRAVIILMGCYGIFTRELPQAFIDRGASVVIGWNGSVDLYHTDQAMLKLLETMLLKRMSVSDSVRVVMSEVGPDPKSGSLLGYYPQDRGSLTYSELFSRGLLQTIPTQLSVSSQGARRREETWVRMRPPAPT